MLQRTVGAVGGGEAAMAEGVAVAEGRAGAAAFGKIIVRSVARDLRHRPFARRARHRLRDDGG
ncbi:MAG: hypothetical protein JSR60_06445 [Proteobacteria bacterium]|nr:hypothetical protein [Pseudomonadota bacterium]